MNPLLNETNKSTVIAIRNMPEFENKAQTDLYCVCRELALVGKTQFIQGLEELAAFPLMKLLLLELKPTKSWKP